MRSRIRRAGGLEVQGQRGLHPFVGFGAGVVEAHGAGIPSVCLDKRPNPRATCRPCLRSCAATIPPSSPFASALLSGEEYRGVRDGRPYERAGGIRSESSPRRLLVRPVRRVPRPVPFLRGQRPAPFSSDRQGGLTRDAFLGGRRACLAAGQPGYRARHRSGVSWRPPVRHGPAITCSSLDAGWAWRPSALPRVSRA